MGVPGDPGTTDGPFSWAVDLNNAGQAVGGTTTADSGPQSFLWQDGVMSSINDEITDGYYPSFEVQAITDDGTLLGQTRSTQEENRDRAAIYAGNELTTLAAAPEPVTVLNCLFTEVLGNNAYVTDDVQRVLGRSPRDFTDYAARTAAAGAWTPAVNR